MTTMTGSGRVSGRAVLLLAVATSLLFPGPAPRAQSVSSSIRGVVRDAGGQPVETARIQARSETDGTVKTALSDAEGRYRLELLAPGLWILVARTADGRLSETRSVTVGLQETLKVDLRIGSGLVEEVKVTGAAPLIDRQETGGELLINAGRVDSLPISGRVLTDLALLDSSVTATPPGNFYGERGTVFVVNGQSGRSNSFLVDGLDNNDQSSGTTLNAFFSQQVIKEFVVQTHQYSAEFGRASGGVLNIITQRGGNEPTAEWFTQGVRSNWNEPGEFVSGLPRDPGATDTTGRLQTGLRYGGPLRKDRAFIFAAYEHQEADEATPYTGVTRDGVAGGVVIAPSRDDNFFLRTDFNFGSSQNLMLRLSADDRSTRDLNVGGLTTPEFGFRLDESDLQLAGSLTSTLSPNLFNEARFLLSRSTFDQLANSDRPGVERPSGSFGGNNLNRQNRVEERLQLVDNVTWSVGHHTFKFGADLGRSRTDVATRFNPNGNFLYDTDVPFEPGDCGDLIQFLFSKDPVIRKQQIRDGVYCFGDPNGIDDDGDGTIDEKGFLFTYPFVYQLIQQKPRATLDDTRVSLFAQDGWQATPGLYLDYGLRYDLSTYTLADSAIVDSKIPNGGAGVDWNNFGPRFGFTWTPGESGRFVLRGGGGVFYDKLVLGFPAVAAITSGTEIGLVFPQGFTFEVTEDYVEQVGIKTVKKDLLFPESLVLRFSTGTRLDTPYAVQWSLGGEVELTPRQTIRADAVRALGYHQPLFRDLNPVVFVDLLGLPTHRDPNVGSIAAIVTEGRSWYSGLDLGWQWRGAASWLAASYTWSKALDLGPDPLKGGVALPPDSDNLPGEKGRTDSDRRHSLVLSGDTPLPFFGMRAAAVVRLMTGAPFNVTTGSDDNTDGFTSDRPKGLGRNTGESTPLSKINPLRREEGLPAVTSLDEPDFAQVDLRLYRPFGIGETRWKGEMLFQVFNLFDRFNAGPIEGRILSRDFGRPIGQIGPPRTFELGFKLGF